MKRNYSVFLGNVGSCFDRYCPAYADTYSIEQLFERVKSIPLLSGVDLVAVPELLKNADVVKKMLKETGLKPVSVAVDTFTQAIYKQGSFSSIDEKIRKKTIEDSKLVIDFAREINCPSITFWPGQDGYDYSFQADYMQERTWFAEGLKEVCNYDKNMQVYLEYKIKEPRTHIYTNTVGTTIAMLGEINEPNCGVALDYGHAFMAYENPAESVVLLKKYGDLLRHVHINDNYRSWDDDMIVGSIHQVEFLEFFYWLNKTGYDGWLTIDQFPYREDGRNAVAESAGWMNTLQSVIEKANPEEIQKVLQSKDAVESSKLIRKLIFNQ